MIHNALRTELNTLLAAPEDGRSPALRRSRSAEWLYASDLPTLYGGSMPEALKEGLAKAGWETAARDGWLELRKAAPEPPEGWYSGPFGPEAACCLSLLDRHRTFGGGAETVQRALIKAGEASGDAYEEACAELHRDWAERLRRGEALPAVSRRYFGA